MALEPFEIEAEQELEVEVVVEAGIAVVGTEAVEVVTEAVVDPAFGIELKH